MASSRIRSLALVLLLAGCDKGNDENADVADSTDSTGDTDSAGDTETETETGGPEDGEGPQTPAEFGMLCMAQTDVAGCDAIPSEHYPWEDQTTWCTWVVEIPVQLEGDVCSFGAAAPSCRMVSASEAGCGGEGENTCGPNPSAWTRMDGDTLLLGHGSGLCNEGNLGSSPCTVTAEGVSEGSPECACLCDPNLPQ